MSISKIVITGQVLRNPEKRFTEGNLAISSFTMNFGDENEEKTIRVFSLGKTAERMSEIVKKGQTVVVEGRLQTNSVKTEAGIDKKFLEINAFGIEILEGSAPSDSSVEKQDEFEIPDEISSDDLIGEDEIPF